MLDCVGVQRIPDLNNHRMTEIASQLTYFFPENNFSLVLLTHNIFH